MKLLTIADGFGDSQAVPDWYPHYVKWPEIIKLMTKGVELQNLSRYGAGNEYILQCLRHSLSDQHSVLVQWAVPDRLDLLLGHQSSQAQFWQEEIAKDPVYANNIVDLGKNKFWLSSQSNSTSVLEYHAKFISLAQHQSRSQMFVDHAKMLLQNRQHGFLLTKTSDYLRSSVNDVNNWHWHQEFSGLCEFRHVSEYADLDLGLAQPVPLIHFDFVRKFIQPKFELPWRNERDVQAVKDMLYRKYKEAFQNRPR